MTIKEYFEHQSEFFQIFNVSPKQIARWNWIVENGKIFTIEDCLSKEGNEQRIKRAKKQQCFYNAQSNALFDDFEYYEGYYCTKGGLPFPIEHGFNVINGKVLDTTAIRWKIDAYEWFGVHIPTDFIKGKWLEFGFAGSFLHLYLREIIFKD